MMGAHMFNVLAVLAFVVAIGCRDADAWGCDGHRAVVFIAERLLSPATLSRIRPDLAAAPIDPALRRFCEPVADDPIADSSTWADDYRDVDATTAGWHFIDVPRDATLTAASARTWCPAGRCVVDVIAAQFRVLRSADATSKGNALRFLLHLIGDIHQPLHATTNGDRGGNCVPVTYGDRVPQQNDRGDWSPNLHSVWDTSTIRTLMATNGLDGPRALAGYVAARQPLPAPVAATAPTKQVVVRWAQGAHALGQSVVYPRLPVAVPLEPRSAARLQSCADNRDVGKRMLARHEVIDSGYERSGLPVIVEQLRLAGIRLAAALEAAYQ